MKVLYISYWSVNDGLSQATVLPHLEILKKFEEVEEIIFCSIERLKGDKIILRNAAKIVHVPLYSKGSSNVFLEKLYDFIIFPYKLIKLAVDRKVDLIICRSSLAGALGCIVSMRLGVPYVVESFEPHADYMIESGIWKTFDPRTLIGKIFEKWQRNYAMFLLPVSNNYKEKLINEGAAEHRIIVSPCSVSIEKFAFNPSQRNRIRNKLGFDNKLIGIYVGKFGGIYYDDEAIALFKSAFEFFGDTFRLIILTANEESAIPNKIIDKGINQEHVKVLKVMHEEVPDYLSAADFAFSTIKTSPSRKYCSPIKNGEYWANGLPILLEAGIGDDSYIIEKEGGGVILDMKNYNEAFQKLETMVATGRENLAKDIQVLAFRYRRLSLVEESYKKIFSTLSVYNNPSA